MKLTLEGPTQADTSTHKGQSTIAHVLVGDSLISKGLSERNTISHAPVPRKCKAPLSRNPVADVWAKFKETLCALV